MNKMTDWFLAELDAESPRTRRTLERVPEGKFDWKPHSKSMTFGRLSMLVAHMPAWVTLIVDRDDLDLNPPGGSNIDQTPLKTAAELTAAMDKNVAEARKSLQGTTDEQLMKPWKLLVSGQTVMEQPRYVVLRETFMHLSHHRGQLTVYLRLNDAQVPSIYGPTADDTSFA